MAKDGIQDFTKPMVLQILNDEMKSAPTFQDKEHPAEWWNDPFGQSIKREWEERFKGIIMCVEIMREESEYYDI